MAESVEVPIIHLKRNYGLLDLTFLGISGIIGAGVFVLTGQVAYSSAGPAVPLSFLLAGVASTFSALCYSEFSSMFPSASGSAYSFLLSMNTRIAFIVGWSLSFEYTLGAAAVAIGFSAYLGSFLSQIGIIDAPFEFSFINWPALFICIVATVVHYVGTSTSVIVNRIIVAIKLCVLVIFILYGMGHVKSENLTPYVPENTGTLGEFGYSGVIRGAALVFFAFIGFDAVSTASREAKNPQKDVALGTLISLAVSTILYCLTSFVMTGMISYRELGVADPITKALSATESSSLSLLKPLLTLGAIAGLTSVVFLQILAQSRIYLAMARDGYLPSLGRLPLAELHPRYHTPWASLILSGGCSALLSAFFSIETLSELVSCGTLFAFFFVCYGVTALRRILPDAERPFLVPFYPYVPYLGMVTSAGLTLALPYTAWLRMLVWVAVGLAVYHFYGRLHARNTEDIVRENLHNDLAPSVAEQSDSADVSGNSENNKELPSIHAPISAGSGETLDSQSVEPETPVNGNTPSSPTPLLPSRSVRATNGDTIALTADAQEWDTSSISK